jgi:uncharacterized protein (DUF1697 family)
MRYIALLRGINVGGKNILKMADLKEALATLAFTNIESYIQSGNLIFDSNTKESFALSQQIEQLIHDTFSLSVPVIVISEDDFLQIDQEYPFAERDPTKMHVTFLEKKVEIEAIKQLQTSKPASDDTFEIIGRSVYLLCEGSYHKSKFNNTFFEKKLQQKASTRNYKTVLKLISMLTKEI